MAREPNSPSPSLNNSGKKDDELITAVLDGNNGAFDELMTRYRDKVFSLSYHLLHNAAAAEDLAQEVFIRAFQGLKKFRREANFYTWLYRIAVNLAYTQTSKNSRRQQLQTAAQNDLAKTLHGRSPDPADQVEKDDLKDKIYQALDRLDPRLRQVLVLREIEGLEVTEVAQVLRLPKGTIKSRLFRAHEDLRRWLSQEQDPPEKGRA